MSAHTQGQAHPASGRSWDGAPPAEDRLPLPLAALVIVSVSLGLWYGLWKAVTYLAPFLA